jgi:hypothetical protein
MHRPLAIVVILMAAGLGGCAQPEPPAPIAARACQETQSKLDEADDVFVSRVRDIRTQHLLVLDYDHKMIEALTAYREKVRTILDEEENSRGQYRCSGKLLADVKLGERPRLDKVASYLMDFQRALTQDSPNAYVP